MMKMAMLALTGLLAACGSKTIHPPAPPPSAVVPASTASGAAAWVETLAPNANLVTQGIPAIPMSLVRQAAKYTDFRGHNFVDWHPSQREMLVSYRKAGEIGRAHV